LSFEFYGDGGARDARPLLLPAPPARLLGHIRGVVVGVQEQAEASRKARAQRDSTKLDELRATDELHATDEMHPDFVYLSIGSHDQIGGGDNAHYERSLSAFRLFFRAGALRRARVVLATTSAISPSRTPTKFLGLGDRCRVTNARVRVRGSHSARTLHCVCALFSF